MESYVVCVVDGMGALVIVGVAKALCFVYALP